MTLQEINLRRDILDTVLFYCRDRAYFSLLQKVCIHQERAALIHAQDRIEETGVSSSTPAYKLPPHLEVKVIQILKDFT